MSNTPPSGNQSPNAPNLNLNEPAIDEGADASSNKGKEVMMVEEQPPNPNNNKRKAIVLGGPDHHHPRDDNGHGPKNPRTGGSAAHNQERGDQQRQNTPPSLRELTIRGDNKPKKTDAPLSYTCDFCDKSFVSPQALGGHQNGHKWERHLRNGADVMHMAADQPPPPSQPLTGTQQGLSLNPMYMNHHNNNNQMMMNAMMMGNGNNQHDAPIYGIFHPSLDTAGVIIMPQGNHEAGNYNTAPFHPQWIGGAGFGSGPIGAMEVGNNNDGFHHPDQGPWFNHGYENGYNNAGGYASYGAAMDPGLHGAFYHPEGAWFNPGYETGYNGVGEVDYYAPFQQPDAEVAWMNHEGIGTGYYGEVDSTYGLHGIHIDGAYAYDPQLLEQGGIEYVFLPASDDDDYQNTGTDQQAAMVEIDFGLVPNCDEEDTETEQEEEAIDLTLKL